MLAICAIFSAKISISGGELIAILYTIFENSAKARDNLWEHHFGEMVKKYTEFFFGDRSALYN